MITDLIERGIESGELSKDPSQGGEDTYAEAIMKCLKGAAIHHCKLGRIPVTLPKDQRRIN